MEGTETAGGNVPWSKLCSKAYIFRYTFIGQFGCIITVIRYLRYGKPINMVTQYVHFFTRNIIFEIHAVKCFCLRTVIFTPYNNCQAICVVSIIYISPVQIGFRKIDLSRTISIVCNMCNVINLRFRSPHGRRTCYSHSIHSSW